MINPEDMDMPQKKAKLRDLQPLSIQELEEYITQLEQEIVRADAAIAQKKAHKSGIDALFGHTSQ